MLSSNFASVFSDLVSPVLTSGCNFVAQ